MSATTDRLQARIVTLTADKARIAAEAEKQTAELDAQIAQLQTMKSTLERTPQLETLLAQAKTLGIV